MREGESKGLYRRASKVMVGGVSSPVRAFRSVGGTPLFVARGRGPHVWDEDGNRFVDYVCSWGALIAGHAEPTVVRDVRLRIGAGTSFGAPTKEEALLAEKVCGAFPSIEKVRFVNSGTEATMSALRLARGYTGRSKVVKFEGCYHGHADPFLTKAGSGMATLDLPASAGVTEGSVADTITLRYNDPAAVESEFSREGEEIAAVIVEPVAGNMGVIPPSKGFLEALRSACSGSGALLIFDEVITGFRVGPGGAQALYGVKPDITTLGKIIGGGFPVGAYGGRKDIMALVSPEGPVYQAGTLSGNPVAMQAGLTTVSLLNRKGYARLESTSRELEEGLVSASARSKVPLTVNRVGSMVGAFFCDGPVEDFEDAKRTDAKRYSRFFWEMLRSGNYLPPSAFETLFVSLAHTRKDIDATVRSAGAAMGKVGA